jgi:hypothetical protein
MHPKTTLFQIINIYSISDQNGPSELQWHYLFKGWCESDVDYEKLKRPHRAAHTIKVPLLMK